MRHCPFCAADRVPSNRNPAFYKCRTTVWKGGKVIRSQACHDGQVQADEFGRAIYGEDWEGMGDDPSDPDWWKG